MSGDSGRNLWNEVSRSGGRLVLVAPGYPATCNEVRVRLRVDSGAPIGTPLFNRAEIAVADDIDLNNQQNQYTAYVSGPRYRSGSDKYINDNVLAPGGWIHYHLWYANRSNQTVTLFTDTLPAGVTYRDGSATREGSGEPMPPQSVTGKPSCGIWARSTWVRRAASISSSMSSNTLAANTVLTNCATIGSPYPEDTPWNNTACYAETIYDHGPNLRIRKYANWNPGQDGIRYNVQFENIGDQEIDKVWITDTLPAATTWQGWWNMNFDWGRLTSNSQSSSVLDWNFSTLYPGDSGWLYFSASMDDPNLRPQWYTNSIEITSPIADLTPADNVAESGIYNGEVADVNLRVSAGRFDAWGRAEPNTVITVTTAVYQATTNVDGWGNWNMNDNGGTFNPGDVVTFTAGNGLEPLVVHVPTRRSTRWPPPTPIGCGGRSADSITK